MTDFCAALRAKMEAETAGDPFGRSNIEYFLGNRADAILALVEAVDDFVNIKTGNGLHNLATALRALDKDV